jgi:hypothetical protein
MPSSSICGESVLLTPNGWRVAKMLPSECEIAAADRHGRVVSTRVQLVPNGKQMHLAYVGTGAAFAALVADARLTANDGKKWKVKDIVECGDVSKIHFETLVRMPDVVHPKPAIDDFWWCLSYASAVANSEAIALRCRDPLVGTRTKSGFLRKKEIGNQVFAIVHKHKLATALSANWRETITTLISCWLRNSDDDRVEVERSAYYVALWFAAALSASGLGYFFQFDTLQHSGYVFVTSSHEIPSPLQKGACAFYTPNHTPATSLTWHDPSLAPISGGFLLAAD